MHSHTNHGPRGHHATDQQIIIARPPPASINPSLSSKHTNSQWTERHVQSESQGTKAAARFSSQVEDEEWEEDTEEAEDQGQEHSQSLNDVNSCLWLQTCIRITPCTHFPTLPTLLLVPAVFFTVNFFFVHFLFVVLIVITSVCYTIGFPSP